MLRPPPCSTLFPYTTLFRSLELDVQELLLIVPLVERRRGIQPLVALEPDEVRPEHPRHDLRDLGLADARGPLDQERLPEAHREVHRRRDRRVRHVVRSEEHTSE